MTIHFKWDHLVIGGKYTIDSKIVYDYSFLSIYFILCFDRYFELITLNGTFKL